MKEFNVIGIMSGTSCDGMDISFCKYLFKNNSWTFEILKCKTYKYDDKWKSRLLNSHNLSSIDLLQLNNEFADLTVKNILKFKKDLETKIDFISSHGHTVFYQTNRNFTYQIGNGAVIASKTKFETICDFRTTDVALNGQGAPLVPIGDKYLFSDFDYCLNLGGFANISFEHKNQRLAFDICPVNIVINNFVSKFFGVDYDNKGIIASKGNINNDILIKLNSLAFYKKSAPKSLGREWVEDEINPIFTNELIFPNNLLRTFYEHVAVQISSVLKKKNSKVLITGGGAKNKFLIKLIEQKSNAKIIIPESNLIDYKEAIIFGFLGILRYLKNNNCLKSVTGSLRDNCGGAIYYY